MEMGRGATGGGLGLALVGDIMLGRGVARAIEEHGPDFPLDGVASLLARGDLRLGNLECALTARGAHWHGGGHAGAYYRAPPDAIAALRHAGIDGVTLANNHTGDFGMAGLLDTAAALDGAGIGHAGAGADLAAAETPARFVRNGWRVSLLSFADHPAVWAAGPSTPGIRYLSIDGPGLARARGAILAERSHADMLVVGLHWGQKLHARPDAGMRTFARGLVEAGADVVWGHGAPLVQGIEWVHGRPVLYGTGALVDDDAQDRALRDDLGAVFLVHARRGTFTGIDVLPTRVRGLRALPAEGTDRAWVVERLVAACHELGTDALVERNGRLVVPTPLAIAGV